MGNSEQSMQAAGMKDKIESVKRALLLSPQNAQITLSGRCRLEDGLPATYEEGGFRYEMDVPSELGGMNSANSRQISAWGARRVHRLYAEI